MKNQKILNWQIFKIKNNAVFLLIFLSLFFITFSSAQAKSILEGIGCIQDGSCQLNDFAKVAVNVASWILGITGSLTLLAFVYGGVMFLISAGSSERINKAKQIIVGAVVGLVIVFASYMIIGFVFTALGVNVSESAWARTGWFGQATPYDYKMMVK
ncbi:MAG: pilin [Planctomycetes bacterium]|jgi:hypothetical protein|nr:pilin [Planctomycetota bacterium]